MSDLNRQLRFLPLAATRDLSVAQYLWEWVAGSFERWLGVLVAQMFAAHRQKTPRAVLEVAKL